jgi:hypothetical protein
MSAKRTNELEASERRTPAETTADKRAEHQKRLAKARLELLASEEHRQLLRALAKR